MAIVSQPTNDNYRENFDAIFKKPEPPTPDAPRRNRSDLWTSPEQMIHKALQIVETLGADIRLTEAVILLGRAQDKVADFIDGIGRCAHADCTAQPLPNKSVCSDHDRALVPYPADRPPRYNARSEPCDMWIGPCCCGAWHHGEDDALERGRLCLGTWESEA